MRYRNRLSEYPFLKGFTLTFRDHSIEEQFISKYVRIVIERTSYVLPVIIIILAGAFVCLAWLLQPPDWIIYLPLILISGITLFYFHLRFSEISTRKLRFFYGPVLCVFPAFIYCCIQMSLPDTFIHVYGFLIISLHMLVVSVMSSILFIDALIMLNAIAAGFVTAILLWGEMSFTEQTVQIVFIVATDIFCLYVNYEQERHNRINFYQRKIIEKREQELAVEKDKSESLLLNILPEMIAERLKNGDYTIADGYPEATVLFCDIVDFTPLSGEIEPEVLLNLLNIIFSTFDELAEAYRLEKIKTIGDAYMVAGGLPEPSDDHAVRVADLALDMMTSLNRIALPIERKLQVRIGIHTGPLIAGVIGKKKFIYDLWGDTVNMAARLESHGLPGEIQISAETRRQLGGNYICESRGMIEIKGKGSMEAFLLKGRKNS